MASFLVRANHTDPALVLLQEPESDVWVVETEGM
jgi:hypothetical protein